MHERRFNPAHLAKLNDPARLIDLEPDLLWTVGGQGPKATVVEIGAGTALFSIEFARRAGQGTVYAAEISEEMVTWMGENLPVDLRDRVIPLHADGVAVPLPDGLADLVVMLNVFHELDEPAAVLAESLRLLRPDGVLLVADWRAEETPKGPPFEHRVPEEVIEEQLRQAGFSSVRSHPGLRYHALLTARKP